MDPNTGGSLEIDYLYNGMPGFRSRRSVTMKIERAGNIWGVVNEGRIIHKIHMVSHRKRFIGTVGIRRIKIIE